MTILHHRPGVKPHFAAATCVALMLLGGCSSPGNTGANTQNVPVNIPFDSNGCPQAPDPATADKDMRIVWQSVDAVTGVKTKESYQIFFDPFVGTPQTSGQDGRLKSKPFKRDVPPNGAAPPVEYKYTIVGARCPDKPMDPRLWLRR